MSTQNISHINKPPLFSVIIPTLNEAEDIGQTLESLLALDYSEYEVLVVDESTDRTFEITQSYTSDKVRYIRQTRGSGRAAARNQGIIAASGEIVIILNADVRLPQDFLSCLTRHYQAGADYVLVESEVSNTEYLLPRYAQAQHSFFYSGEKTINMNWTEGFSCRREAAIDVGLIPEGQGMPLVAGEDGWFGERLHAAGYCKVFDHELLVTHVAPTQLRAFFEQRVGRGHGSGQMWISRSGVSLRILGHRAILHTLLRVVSTAVFIPVLWHAWRYSGCSPRGRRDFVPFSAVYLLESWANLFGIWRSYFELRRTGVISR